MSVSKSALQSSLITTPSVSLITSSHLIIYPYRRRTSPPFLRRKNLRLASSRKSSCSINIFLPNGIVRVPAELSSGLLIASMYSTRSSGQFVSSISSGFSTAILRGASRFKTPRTACSNNAISLVEGTLVIPTVAQKLRTASAGYPRLRIPDNVGMRGSCHPSTTPASTSVRNFRLLTTVYVKFKRANSVCLDGNISSLSINHSYKGR